MKQDLIVKLVEMLIDGDSATKEEPKKDGKIGSGIIG